MLEEKTNQGQDCDQGVAEDAPQILSYQEQKSRINFLDDSSSESDEEMFMMQISQKVGQMDNQEEDNEVIPRTRNEKVVQVEVDEKPETKEERELKFKYATQGDPQLLEVGYMESIMKDSIIIHPGSTGVILNLDQLVISESREILGVIEDVFGRIETPHYRILNDPYTQRLIGEGKLKLLDRLYIDSSNKKLLCQDHLQILMKKKGCDASNQFDEEVDDKEKEYSDDENEQVHKKKKNKSKGKKDEQPRQHTNIPRSNEYKEYKPPQHQHQHQPNNQPPQHQHQHQHPPTNQQQYPKSFNQPNFHMNQQQPQQFPMQQQQQQFPPQQQQQQQYNYQHQPNQPQQYPHQQNNQPLPSQFVQIGAQYFTMLPGGIPNLLNPKVENSK